MFFGFQGKGPRPEWVCRTEYRRERTRTLVTTAARAVIRIFRRARTRGSANRPVPITDLSNQTEKH